MQTRNINKTKDAKPMSRVYRKKYEDERNDQTSIIKIVELFVKKSNHIMSRRISFSNTL